jgi:hypothetical protein
LFLICFVLTCASPKPQNTVYVLSLDEKDRPICDCLETNSDGLAAIWVSMNCKKSVVDNIYLCSEERALHVFKKKDECEKALALFTKANGKHTLADDPWNKKPCGE